MSILFYYLYKVYIQYCCISGTLIRRHRIPKPQPNDDQFYTVEDFNIDKELMLYSRKFKLVDCDQFTSNFLSKLGVRVKSGSNRVPDDPYIQHRKAVSLFHY